jgi:hypothetical protein
MFARVGKAINLMHGFTQACAAMVAANLGAHIRLERSLARLDIQADDSRAESGRIQSDGLSKGSALLSEVTRTGSLGHEFRRSQYIARNRRDVPTRLLTPPKRKNCQQPEFSSFWTFSRQMAWVCAEPSRSRTSDNSDERFHVQQDVRHARTSHRTFRNDTGKSAWHSSPARRVGQILPAMHGSILAHSNAENGRIRGSPSAHRTLRRQRQHPIYGQVSTRPSRQVLTACGSSRRAAPAPQETFAFSGADARLIIRPVAELMPSFAPTPRREANR